MTNLLLKGVFSILVSINFYTLDFQDTDGNTVNMSNFQGKKVLIVNIATGSDKIHQLAGLQQLQQQFNDSLVVVVFPSNSFGHEARNNSEIKEFCHSTYSSTFLIATKSSVTGQGVNSVFSWLASKTQNGEVDAITGGDFQKFLVDKDGMLIGVFSPKINPTDPELISAITTSF
jgi:glutathione peroxidase